VGVCYGPPDQEDQVDGDRSSLMFISPGLRGGTLTTLISGGGTKQQGISDPGGSWEVLITSCFK